MGIQQWRITEINMILYLRQTGGHLRQFKNRKDYGLIFVENGSIRFEHGRNVYTADNSRIMLVAKDIDYAITFESTCSFFVINFDMKDNGLDSPFHAFNACVSGRIVDFLRHLCIDWDFRSGEVQSSYITRVYQLLAMIDQAVLKNANQGSVHPAIAPSIEYLKEHYTDPDINNDMLARISNISTVYFRKLFYQQYGQSPMSYIRMKRIEHAKMLLRSEYYGSISDIALYSGFNSLYHFSKTFRQLVGVSPSEFLSGGDPDYAEPQSNATPTGNAGSETSRS